MSVIKKEKPRTLLKALTVANILNQVVTRIKFTGNWYQAFKQPQDKGVWLVWGTSGSGKSYFIMMLAKAMAQLGYSVFLNLCEEDMDDSDFIERVETLEMNDVTSNFLARTYDHDDLVEYLNRKNSPKVVIIDSATYFFESFDQYLAFKKMFKQKIIIITAHARGEKPKYELEDRIMFDAKMKIYINGFLAICKGRTIGPNGGRFIIWQEGYETLRGKE
jgi:hypothetical protein